MIGRITRHQAFRQLVKFCIVGASSTVVDKSFYYALLVACPQMPWWLAQTCSFCLGVTNGFTWNRLWTFKGQSKGSIAKQYPVFVMTNIIGLLLTLAITKGMLVLLTGQMVHAENPDRKLLMLASFIPIPFVMVWNFSAAKFLAFRGTPSGVEPPVPPLAEPR